MSQDPFQTPAGSPAPEDVQGTALAPDSQGTALAPDSQGTALAGPGEASSAQPPLPVPDGVLLSSGSEADLYLQTGPSGAKVAYKCYRPGCHFVQAVNEALEPLRGKGYVADVTDYGVRPDGRDYETMPYYPLGSAAACADLRRNADAILAVVVKTAVNLDQCHRLGVLHKDVKPANILLVDKDTWDCVLGDFGIADILPESGKVSTTQVRTPIYAAPEVYDSASASYLEGRTYCLLGPEADFYSLGMSILCLWMGEGAFKSREATLAYDKLHGTIPVPDEIPEPLRTVARGLLVKDPARRWGLDEIERCIAGEDVPVPDPSTSRQGTDPAASADTSAIGLFLGPARPRDAASLATLARMMVQDRGNARILLYRGRISRWLSPEPALAADLDRITETDYPTDQATGTLAAVLRLDPMLDLCLGSDPSDPLYAMDGVSMANVVMAVFNSYWMEAGGDEAAFRKLWARPGVSPYQARMDADLAIAIAGSFSRYQGSYLQAFLKSKGDRFKDLERWVRTETDFSRPDLRKRAGPSDTSYRSQVAMLRTARGWGLARPGVLVPAAGRRIDSVQALDNMSPRDFVPLFGKGLGAFIALYYHEDTDADLTVKYTYEKLLKSYLERIASFSPYEREVIRFREAQGKVAAMRSGRSWRGAYVARRLRSQKIVGVLAGVLPAVLLAVGGATCGATGGWVVAVAALALAAWGAVKVLFGGRGKSPAGSGRQGGPAPDPSGVVDPVFEHEVLEPLYYAFNTESTFHSSLEAQPDAPVPEAATMGLGSGKTSAHLVLWVVGNVILAVVYLLVSNGIIK